MYKMSALCPSVSKCLIGKSCDTQPTLGLSGSVEMNKNHSFTFVRVFFPPSFMNNLFNVHTNQAKVDCPSFLDNAENPNFCPISAKVFDEKFKRIIFLILRRFESHDRSC